MIRIIADISVSLDGFVGAASRTLVQRSVISTSTAAHLTYDVSRVIR
ncbi:hypothetical protein AB0F68_34355 [Micromonospora sp. NPDC023966]